MLKLRVIPGHGLEITIPPSAEPQTMVVSHDRRESAVKLMVDAPKAIAVGRVNRQKLAVQDG